MFRRYKITSDTILYRSGNPFKTNAIVFDINFKNFKNVKKIPHLKISLRRKGIVLYYNMNKKDRIFGLGESLGAFNKRGKRYILYSTDVPEHTPEKESLYGVHPSLIIDGKKTFGFLIDFPSELIFDIGYTHKNILSITIPSKDFDIYFFNTSDKKHIIKEYLFLTGYPYVPPRWAFGYQQSRWSYPNANSIKKIARNFRRNDIPCDVIYMDIDYMDDYKTFTLNHSRFPHFKKFVKDLKKQGFKLIPIVNPGVKIEKGYYIYEEGVKNGYFCFNKKGRLFKPAVWPGYTHFPDFLNSKTRKWWGKLYKKFVKYGIEGFWNDMNEPSIFYTTESINEIRHLARNIDEKDSFAYRQFRKKMIKYPNRRDYYKEFYHRLDNGKLISHDKIHNLYGYNMTRAAAEGLRNIMNNKRYFLLSRSSYTGLHRFAGIWTGDNASWWEHMLVHIRMIMSLNLVGYFYSGADIGGFGKDTSAELLIRWIQLGVFTPLFRNHSAKGTRYQEPWAFDEETKKIIKDIIKLRYAFLPYIYSEFMRCVKECIPFISPLFLHINTERVKDIEDQYMFGNSLMIAPVYKPNTMGRYVHIPESIWLHWNASKYNKQDMRTIMPGDYYIKADLTQIPLFIKENSLIALTKPMSYVDEEPIKHLTIIGLVTKQSEFRYYEDDGITYAFEKGKYSILNIKVKRISNDLYKIKIEKDERGGFKSVVDRVDFKIYDERGQMHRYTIKM